MWSGDGSLFLWCGGFLGAMRTMGTRRSEDFFQRQRREEESKNKNYIIKTTFCATR